MASPAEDLRPPRELEVAEDPPAGDLVEHVRDVVDEEQPAVASLEEVRMQASGVRGGDRRQFDS